MLRERFFPGLQAAGSKPARSPRLSWQWIFPVLIVVGLILVLASLLYLLGGPGGSVFPTA
ncbi:MAG TPA: hypothetical protein VHX37_16525 [Acidobacteriaceae bacterium]|jgi:hypothetical protein|nr:hypothetical protein [Acidobacteriaceae bacterium]